MLDLFEAPVARKPVVATPAPAAAPAKPRSAPEPRKPRGDGPAKLFVLDTNVLMHDPTSLFRFEEHDIYLPMITLEELDGHKRGMTEVARNSRAMHASAAATSMRSPRPCRCARARAWPKDCR